MHAGISSTLSLVFLLVILTNFHYNTICHFYLLKSSQYDMQCSVGAVFPYGYLKIFIDLRVLMNNFRVFKCIVRTLVVACRTTQHFCYGYNYLIQLLLILFMQCRQTTFWLYYQNAFINILFRLLLLNKIEVM